MATLLKELLTGDRVVRVEDDWQTEHHENWADSVTTTDDLLDDVKTGYAENLEVGNGHYERKIGPPMEVRVFIADEDDSHGEDPAWEGYVDVNISPDPPRCEDEDSSDHDWKDLGSSGKGGGIVSYYLCSRCEWGKKVDSWDQNWASDGQPCDTTTYERNPNW